MHLFKFVQFLVCFGARLSLKHHNLTPKLNKKGVSCSGKCKCIGQMQLEINIITYQPLYLSIKNPNQKMKIHITYKHDPTTLWSNDEYIYEF